MKDIRSNEIKLRVVEICPTLTLTGKMFSNACICWIGLEDGRQYEMIFDGLGDPLYDTDLIKRLGDYYKINFQPILFDGKVAYAAEYFKGSWGQQGSK